MQRIVEGKHGGRERGERVWNMREIGGGSNHHDM